MDKDRKAIVIGVGAERGLGAALCRKFASEGYHVFVAGRTREKLDRVVAQVQAGNGQATAVVADAGKANQIAALFKTARQQDSGVVDLAVFNVGNNVPGKVLDIEPDYFAQAWRIGCFGGFLFGREAIRSMREHGGTLIFTGASASMRGRAGFAAFSASKAGLRHLAQCLAKEHAADAIHVAHVVVDGGIAGDKIMKHRPEIVEQYGEDRLIELEGIADSYWFLHQQPQRAWTFELDLRTYLEPW